LEVLEELEVPTMHTMRPSVSGNATYPRLVGDIGGTHARFGLVMRPRGLVQDVAVLRCAEHDTVFDAIQAYLRERAGAAPRVAAIGVATAVTGDEVRMTNHPWTFSIEALQRALGLDRLLVINDFSALALALPELPLSERRAVGGGHAVPGAPIALIGPGTGLGVSGLIPVPGGSPLHEPGHGTYVPIAGEGGHVTLMSSEPDEAAVLDVLHRRYGHASAERALSGPGLQALYDAVCSLRGVTPRPLTAAQVSRSALDATDPDCARAVAMFCSLLGHVAGNLALTLGARGGVYIGGGIVPRLGEWFTRSSFRDRFESKGRFRDYLRDIPTWVVTSAQSPALSGACRALDLPAPATPAAAGLPRRVSEARAAA
jgi:glucokinase